MSITIVDECKMLRDGDVFKISKMITHKRWFAKKSLFNIVMHIAQKPMDSRVYLYKWTDSNGFSKISTKIIQTEVNVPQKEMTKLVAEDYCKKIVSYMEKIINKIAA